MTNAAASNGPLAGVRILLGVTGGIGAYKAALLARLLVGDGAHVDPVLTRGAREFIGAATFEGITGQSARTEVFDGIHANTHVALGHDADLAVIYPATAHTIAKVAHGLADDLLTSTLLAATCPLLVAPAMHTEMFEHAATQANLDVLRTRGVVVVGPADGALMGGDVGPGRLVEPDVVHQALLEQHAAVGDTPGSPTSPDMRDRGDLEGRTIVVTAGGTREPIDPVRYLGNRSSGRMGFALAAAATERGARVHLVAAPTDLPTPDGVERTDVTTALQMRDAVMELFGQADVIIKAAAVADFRPESATTHKIKKDQGVPTISLTPNPDILADLGQKRASEGGPLLVGFAAETDDVEANGAAKLRKKNADLLVVNDVSATDAGFGVDTNKVVVLDRDGGRYEYGLAAKREIADDILSLVVSRL